MWISGGLGGKSMGVARSASAALWTHLWAGWGWRWRSCALSTSAGEIGVEALWALWTSG